MTGWCRPGVRELDGPPIPYLVDQLSHHPTDYFPFAPVDSPRAWKEGLMLSFLDRV